MSNLLKPDIAPDPRARCGACGAMSYRRMIARDAAGRLTPNGLYQCTGCSMTFSDPKAWHAVGRSPGSAEPASRGRDGLGH